MASDSEDDITPTKDRTDDACNEDKQNETQCFLRPEATESSDRVRPSSSSSAISNKKLDYTGGSSVNGSLRLSDSTSIVSGEEIQQRREALKLFSSQLSMASSLATTRSTSLIPGMTINYELTPFSSTLSSLNPLCRICQCSAETHNVLITPCRCDGSLKHVHATCLLKWIEVANRKRKNFGRPAFCELCGYIYKRQKFVKYREWKWPRIAARDKLLHTIFIISLITMIGCAIATVFCFITDDEQRLSGYKRPELSDRPLTREEVITICCGITFFVSFFISMTAEIKAKRTIYQICRKCMRHNTVWVVENYHASNDREYRQLRNDRLLALQQQSTVET